METIIVNKSKEEIIVFANNGEGYADVCEDLSICSSNDKRNIDLGGVLIILGKTVSHALGIFFKDYPAIKIHCDKSFGKYGIIIFSDLADNKLLRLNLALIGGINNLTRLCTLEEEGAPEWNGRLMYDFTNHFIKGCHGFGYMGAIAVPFEEVERNGVDVPQIFADTLFKKYI